MTPRDEVDIVVKRLEAMYLRVVELDAYQGATDDLFHRLLWSSDGDPDHRRDYNRLGIFVDRVVEMIFQLLAETDDLLRAAMRLRKK